MKSLLLLTLSVASVAAQAPGMRQVYLMPMAGGLDQYLAAQIARAHVMQVVTDPKTADVVLTDRIGPAFEQQLDELYPSEKKGEEKDPEAKKPDEKVGGAGADGPAHRDFRSTAPRGTVFMVDTRTRHVVWSDHEKPVEPTDARLNRVARLIVRKLQPKPARP